MLRNEPLLRPSALEVLSHDWISDTSLSHDEAADEMDKRITHLTQHQGDSDVPTVASSDGEGHRGDDEDLGERTMRKFHPEVFKLT